MGKNVEIKGLDKTLKYFDKAPENALIITRKAMKDAARAVSKQITSRTPQRWRTLTKGQVKLYKKKGQSGETVAKMGWIDKGQKKRTDKRPNPPSDWYKAYWSNFGTIYGRDPDHKFKYPVKHGKTVEAKRRVNRRGIHYLHFYDYSIEGWYELYQKEFRKAMKRYQDEFKNY